MAKELSFSLAGAEYAAAPVKLERKKIYGWSDLVATGRYPAYIFYHTDYSSARKELIKRDMAFSSDEQQIRDILVAEISDNIKKGWEEVL